MGQMRLYNEGSRRWERFTVEEVSPRPWRFIRLEALLALRRLRDARARRADPTQYDYDPDTLRFTDPRRERRMRRRDRWDRLIATAANALNSMVEMQKFLK